VHRLLDLSAEKSRVCHIDEGFDFLGFRIQRRTKPGTTKRYLYTWPSKKSLNTITDKVRKLTRRRNHKTLADLLIQVNPVLRGWCTYFKHGVSKRTFEYVDHFAFWRVVRWSPPAATGPAAGCSSRRSSCDRTTRPAWACHTPDVAASRCRRCTACRYRPAAVSARPRRPGTGAAPRRAGGRGRR
jgi:RNA-directed DNA polymerase